MFRAAERETIVIACKSFIQSLEPTPKHTILLWFIFNHFRRRFHSVFYSDIFIAYCLLAATYCTTYNWPSKKKWFHLKRAVEFNRIHQSYRVLFKVMSLAAHSFYSSNPFCTLYHHWVINGQKATFIWSCYRNVDSWCSIQYPNRLKMMGNIWDFIFFLPR